VGVAPYMRRRPSASRASGGNAVPRPRSHSSSATLLTSYRCSSNSDVEHIRSRRGQQLTAASSLRRTRSVRRRGWPYAYGDLAPWSKLRGSGASVPARSSVHHAPLARSRRRPPPPLRNNTCEPAGHGRAWSKRGGVQVVPLRAFIRAASRRTMFSPMSASCFSDSSEFRNSCA
jgi:hypothetical protein